MNIEEAVYNHIKATIAATYRKKAPTPGTGSYVVIDMISDVTQYNKDISAATKPGSRCRVQIKTYSASDSDSYSLISQVETIIRSIHNNVYSNVTLLHATDEGTTAGYNPTNQRYFYNIDAYIHAKVT